MGRLLLASLAMLGLIHLPIPVDGESRTISVDDRVIGTGDNQFRYTGQWMNGSGVDYHGGTRTWSDTPGASATLTFRGTQITLYGGTGANTGIGRVSIDGGPAYEVDFYTPSDQGDVELWTSRVLPAGPHTFTLTVAGIRNNVSSGTYVVPDRVSIIRSDTRRILARDFGYSGSWTDGGSDTPGSSISVPFSGAAANFFGAVGPDGGSANVSIDGDPWQKVNFSAGTARRGVLLWRSGALQPGQHVFRLRVIGGGRVVAVGLEIVREAAIMPIPTTAAGSSTGWAKFARNPVLGKNYGTAFDTSVLHESGVYRMWFSARLMNAIAYAESVDGVSWTRPSIVLRAVPGTWESLVNRPSVIYNPDRGQYQMWYTGQRNSSKFGYATSANGITWQRDTPNPVMEGTVGWEKGTVLNPCVLWDSDQHLYRMWYAAGNDWEPEAIGYATSTDGVNWTKSGRNPVLAADPAQTWERDRVSGANVFRLPDGYYYMFYIGYVTIHRGAIGIARSADGVTWSRMPTNPVLAPVVDSWECDSDYKPSVLWESASGSWKLWYNGRCGTPEQQGLAVHNGEPLGF
ncbi:hypothetical protein [Nonomuraea sediminis]|uniref:hypothetical protein n=1 Tax=Nonomuraea sediminis TaxID=2835864 RepID=UPI001BDBE3DF|nr:hypothetical protein [Nonomuraea sediminis]